MRNRLNEMGQQQIDEIERLDITRVIEDIRDTAGPQAARAVFSYLRGVMNWHAGRSRFSTPVVPKMLKAMNIKPQKRQRMLSDDELRAVWAAAGNGTMFGLYVKFLTLSATRRNEAAHMRRSEVNGPDWIIPEERYKTGLRLLVPLSKTAAGLVAEIPRLGRSDFVFTVSGKVPMADFSQ
jgi:integrase